MEDTTEGKEKGVFAALKRKRTYIKAEKIIFFALLVAILLHVFVIQPFIVSGDSMLPTYHPGDLLVIDRLAYRFGEPHKGDVIVFHYPLDPSLYFIKRIDALPGQTVQEYTGKIVAAPSGSVPAAELYDATSTRTLTLAKGEYFVLGDNSAESSDSRTWGPLQKRLIVGRVLFRLWPL